MHALKRCFSTPEARYRGAVTARVLAASLGGYLLTTLVTALLGYGLPGSRASAVLTATMLSFAVWAGLVIWVFAARSAGLAVRGVVGAIGVAAAALLLVQHGA